MIRDARPEDAAAIGAIWNPIIRDTVITFWPTERSEAEIRAYITERTGPGHGCFVWEEDGRIGGFASYGQFRAGGGYAHSMEHSINVAPRLHGTGAATALLTHLEQHAATGGARLMIGGITGSNLRSIAFHQRHGYTEWGRIPAAGRKFGQWHDLVFMGKDLTG
ncbi:phosphinothricin acetyltransferase [Paracoccus isoporae]|uniref:Phosphinothricin acetyltransferase n=1 Tax=Paracoccus isoporae TaxID=591205 RepID=A0A1G7ELS2_9RHOB|nr:GNAT family N-acetyltransferase [Paracoccus isoporae]SDE64638.1 phosphinothricin acetyltransferase [Paracoccus isoporae]